MRKNRIVAVRRAKQLADFTPPSTFDIYMQNNKNYLTSANDGSKWIGKNMYKVKTAERNSNGVLNCRVPLADLSAQEAIR